MAQVSDRTPDWVVQEPHAVQECWESAVVRRTTPTERDRGVNWTLRWMFECEVGPVTGRSPRECTRETARAESWVALCLAAGMPGQRMATGIAPVLLGPQDTMNGNFSISRLLRENGHTVNAVKEHARSGNCETQLRLSARIWCVDHYGTTYKQSEVIEYYFDFDRGPNGIWVYDG